MDVPIPSNVVIHCPAARFALRRAAKCCPSCPRYEGVAVAPVPDPQWPRDFQVMCAWPLTRRLGIVED